ncbi:DUF6612 family protein [Streptococcus pantholopis]|uniref:Lipoprotein n=1 Tax=Streptococcus pantholopis TaxID=1811193 RepID=A0A172Q8X3_9STRE|nr:DUF6612 family protein [Streptococcus pantholopis]AND79882.1 hypothetical protein A0O21_07630 [Streptococcus pantholopis]
MKRKLYYGFICLLALICLTACGTSNRQTKQTKESSSQQELTVDQLLKKAKRASNKVTSVAVDMQLDIKSSSGNTHQDFLAQAQYDNGELTKVSSQIEETSGSQTSYDEVIAIQTDNNRFTYYQRTDKNGQWRNGEWETIDLDPDYFSFLDIVYKMSDDLTIEEEDDAYVLSLRSQNIDLISLFSDELNLSLTGVEQTEVEKDFEIRFDKKTFYLEEFDMDLNYKGAKGSLSMDIGGTYSDWNKVKDSVFDAPSTDNI